MIRLLIADDHQIVREGLKRIVAEYVDLQVIGEAVDGYEVIAKSKGADVVLLDVSMPGPGFLETLRRLREDCASTRVLVLSVHPEDHYAVRAMRAGASGYLTKDHSPQELGQAIRRVASGGKYVTAALAEKLACEVDGAVERQPHEVLSDREYQVLRMLGAGKSVKEIAYTLSVSPKTVSTYRARLLMKMRLESNADLIRYVVERELGD